MRRSLLRKVLGAALCTSSAAGRVESSSDSPSMLLGKCSSIVPWSWIKCLCPPLRPRRVAVAKAAGLDVLDANWSRRNLLARRCCLLLLEMKSEPDDVSSGVGEAPGVAPAPAMLPSAPANATPPKVTGRGRHPLGLPQRRGPPRVGETALVVGVSLEIVVDEGVAGLLDLIRGEVAQGRRCPSRSFDRRGLSS